MNSFRSQHYPNSRKGLRILQEYAMQYYATFNVVIMLGVLIKVISGGFGGGLVIVVVLAELAAIGLGNLLAYAKLKRNIAEIFFTQEHFSLISVYDIVYNPESKHAFPLAYANPTLSADRNQIVVHFNDQVITLHREDWDEFDLIVNWMYAR
ncbi:hypothetical protein [Pontibacter sp. G13]|uniref:hypothetical protein n=1 Tax=Pontibacter sp. G13 TaxID=3074898 RepID=UPI00288ADAAA|nr:hypothetical protein [Pontibacter sp. G13]WNJ20951.1 hypothetical protein RJD25_10785 [Pontibacter sp. G13]